MTNYNQLEIIRKEVISKFTKDELKQYINQLTKKYYITFINNDDKSHNSIISQFYDITSMFESIYPNIESYINYCLLKSANDLIQKSFQRDFTLKYLNNVNIDKEISTVEINLLEKVKAKRKELKDLENNKNQNNGDMK